MTPIGERDFEKKLMDNRQKKSPFNEPLHYCFEKKRKMEQRVSRRIVGNGVNSEKCNARGLISYFGFFFMKDNEEDILENTDNFLTFENEIMMQILENHPAGGS